MMSKFSYIKSLMICCALFLMASCSKSTYHEPVFAAADLPAFHAGDTWRYRVRDSLHRTTDTLTLSIVSVTATGSGDSIHCQILDTGTVVDSAYFILSATELTYQGYSFDSRLASYKLKLPFQAGDTWTYTNSQDSISSLPYLPQVTLSDISYYVFDMSRKQQIPDNGIMQHIQVSRNIGMVSESYSFSGLIGVQQKFSAELIDYQFH